ncbi:MAG: hypothetical protein GC152_16040, partial [Alphaproteobacteria bacterium]|nr:hypothetical protein [Alphaproteobacteria bacterium]
METPIVVICSFYLNVSSSLAPELEKAKIVNTKDDFAITYFLMKNGQAFMSGNSGGAPAEVTISKSGLDTINLGAVDKVDSQRSRTLIQRCLLGDGDGSRVDDGQGVEILRTLRDCDG